MCTRLDKIIYSNKLVYNPHSNYILFYHLGMLNHIHVCDPGIDNKREKNEESDELAWL